MAVEGVSSGVGHDASFGAGRDRSSETSFIDRRAVDRFGELLGIVVDVYDDAATRRPAWLAISTGFFGARVTVAPVQGRCCSARTSSSPTSHPRCARPRP